MKNPLPLTWLALTLLLLDPGSGQAAAAVAVSPPAADDAAIAMHDHGCAGDECHTGSCPPQPDDAGGCAACHCACGHVLGLVASAVDCVTDAMDPVQAAESAGPVPLRPDHPFRPPI